MKRDDTIEYAMGQAGVATGSMMNDLALTERQQAARAERERQRAAAEQQAEHARQRQAQAERAAAQERAKATAAHKRVSTKAKKSGGFSFVMLLLAFVIAAPLLHYQAGLPWIGAGVLGGLIALVAGRFWKVILGIIAALVGLGILVAILAGVAQA
ncbi:MAG: hypothetical protein AAGI37_15320 [Planctomycetota bacterium]